MRFTFYSLVLICLTACATQGFEEEIVKTEQHLTEILNVVGARVEENIKSSLLEYAERLKSYVPLAETVLKQYLSENTGHPRVPIIPPLPESISLPDLRLIKFDAVILWGNISFWDHSLDGLNTLRDSLGGEDTPEGGYKANFRIDIGELSLNGMYDIDIIANLSTGKEGSIDDPIGLAGNGESFLKVEDIFLDLGMNFGKDPDSGLIKVDVVLALGSGNVSIDMQNLTLSIGEFLIIPLPVGALDPILTPLLNNVLGLVGSFGGPILKPLLQSVFQSCELAEVITFFKGEGHLPCAFVPIPDPTATEPAPTEASTRPTTPRRPRPSGAASNFQNSLPMMALLSFFAIFCVAIRLH